MIRQNDSVAEALPKVLKRQREVIFPSTCLSRIFCARLTILISMFQGRINDDLGVDLTLMQSHRLIIEFQRDGRLFNF